MTYAEVDYLYKEIRNSSYGSSQVCDGSHRVSQFRKRSGPVRGGTANATVVGGVTKALFREGIGHNLLEKSRWGTEWRRL